MRIMSTGQPSTLGNHRKIAAALFGEDSKAVVFLDEKIKESQMGEDEEVVADEGQFVNMLAQLHFKGDE